jgi:hypothetical protein
MNAYPLGHHADGQRALTPRYGNVSAKLCNGTPEAQRKD